MAKSFLLIQPDDQMDTIISIDLESICWAKYTESKQQAQHLQISFRGGKDLALTGKAAQYVAEQIHARKMAGRKKLRVY